MQHEFLISIDAGQVALLFVCRGFCMFIDNITITTTIS